MTISVTKDSTLRAAPCLTVSGGRLSNATSNDTLKPVTNANFVKPPRSTSPPLSTLLPHSSAKPTSTLCSCHLLLAFATSSKPIAHSLHGPNGVHFVLRLATPSEPSFSTTSYATGVLSVKSSPIMAPLTSLHWTG